MMSPLFESLVVNNLTLLADEPDASTAMVLNEAEIQEDGRARFLFPRETGIDLVGMSAVIAHGTY